MWTPPRTWVHDEIVSEALLNTHLRDNLLETAPGKASAAGQQVWSDGPNSIAMVPNSKRKSGNQSFIAKEDDDDLYFAMQVNEWYTVRLQIFTSDPSHAGIYLYWVVPTGCVGAFTYRRYQTNEANFGELLAGGLVLDNGTNALSALVAELILQNGASSGNFQLQFSNGGGGPAIQVLSTSNMLIDRLK